MYFFLVLTEQDERRENEEKYELKITHQTKELSRGGRGERERGRGEKKKKMKKMKKKKEEEEEEEIWSTTYVCRSFEPFEVLNASEKL